MLSTADNELATKTDPGTPMGELYRRFWLPDGPGAWLEAPRRLANRAAAPSLGGVVATRRRLTRVDIGWSG